MREYLEEKSIARRIMKNLAAWIHNLLSDGNMEPMICKDYPGNVAKGIQMYNDCIVKSFQSVEDSLANDPLQGILNVLFQYLYMKGWVGNADAFSSFIDPSIDVLDTLFRKSNAKDRVQGTTKILSILWPFIKDLIDRNDTDSEDRLNRFFLQIGNRYLNIFR